MEFDEGLRAALVVQFMARDRNLQLEAAEALTELAIQAESTRIAMLDANRMDEALRSLGGRHFAEALRFELLMCVCLKDGDADKAWDNLIRAQIHYNYAMRSHPAWGAQLADKCEQLLRMEKDLFPPQVFMSAGLIVRAQECSICRKDYQTCEHISGRIYNAEFCSIRLSNVTADHVAIVKEPANKMCRVTHFTSEEGRRNRMTWAIVPDGVFSSQPLTEGTLHAEAAIAASVLESHDAGYVESSEGSTTPVTAE